MRNRIRDRARKKAAIERTAARELEVIIRKSGQAIASRVASGSPWQTAIDKFGGEIGRMLLAALKRGAAAGADDVRGTVKVPEKKSAPQAPFAPPFVLSWIRRHAAKRVHQISKTTAKAVRRQIIDGARRGWSNDRIAKAIREATGGEIGKRRALRIARTETHTAFERGSYEQAREVQRLGIEIEKSWSSTEDKRTRPDHAAVNGQSLSLDGLFSVGSEKMRFPGDPRASARQIINCRCSALYYPKSSKKR